MVEKTIWTLFALILILGLPCMQFQKEDVYIYTNPVRVEYDTKIYYKGFLCDYLGTRVRVDSSNKKYFIVDEHGNKQEVEFKR